MGFGIWLSLSLIIPGLALVFVIMFPVSLISYLIKRHKRKKDAARVTEDALEEEKRRLILYAVLLLVILALIGVWWYIGSQMTTFSM